MQEATPLFDADLWQRRRARAMRQFAEVDFIQRRIEEHLLDCLLDMRRGFPRVLVIGCADGRFAQALEGRFGIEALVLADEVQACVPEGGVWIRNEVLPQEPEAYDAVILNAALHRMQDVPGVLAQVQRLLVPDGLVLACFPGGETLNELRQSVREAEIAVLGGLSPRVIPFMDVRDTGGLLQRAGFALPVVDSDRFQVTYAHLFDLMKDLRAMGAANPLFQRRRAATPKGVFIKAAEYYAQHFPATDGSERIAATVELILAIGWKPAVSQPRPAQRGSGKHSLRDALK